MRKTRSALLLAALAAATMLEAMPTATWAGDIFVSNWSTGTIGEYTTSGAPINAQLFSNMTQMGPDGIAVVGNDLFITNEATDLVGEYSTTGQTINASLISTGYRPISIIAVGDDLFVGDQRDELGEYTTSGATINATLISNAGLNEPSGLAIVGSSLFIANEDGPGVDKFTTGGALIQLNFILDFNYPVAIAASGNDLFVANEKGGTVDEYTTDGVLVKTSLITGLSDPQGMAILGNDIFITSLFGTVGEYTTSGATVNAALITGLGYGLTAIAVVPEPSGIALAAIGLLSMAAVAHCTLRKRTPCRCT